MVKPFPFSLHAPPLRSSLHVTYSWVLLLRDLYPLCFPLIQYWAPDMLFFYLGVCFSVMAHWWLSTECTFLKIRGHCPICLYATSSSLTVSGQYTSVLWQKFHVCWGFLSLQGQWKFCQHFRVFMTHPVLEKQQRPHLLYHTVQWRNLVSNTQSGRLAERELA